MRTVTAVALLAAGLLIAAAPAGARDWNRTDDPMLDAVGLHAGKIGGVGLAFKFPVQWWLYGQVAGGIWHAGDHRRHNVGFQFQYVMRQDRRTRVYLAAGLGYFHHREKLAVVGGGETYEKHNTWNSGFGVGLETLRGERWSLQIEGDFTHESDDDSFIFFPQIGAFYYF